MLVSRLLSFIFISLIFCSGEITISRTYAVNTDISKSISNDNSKIFEKTWHKFSGLVIQVLDTCLTLIITYNKYGNKIFISEFISYKNDNPFVPDWGSLEVSGFGEIDDDKINYVVNFNIKPGYHIFTTDTLLSCLGTGNTDFFWEDNDFLVALFIKSLRLMLNTIKFLVKILVIMMVMFMIQIDYSNQYESKEGSSTYFLLEHLLLD